MSAVSKTGRDAAVEKLDGDKEWPSKSTETTLSGAGKGLVFRLSNKHCNGDGFINAMQGSPLGPNELIGNVCIYKIG